MICSTNFCILILGGNEGEGEEGRREGVRMDDGKGRDGEWFFWVGVGSVVEHYNLGIH